MKIFGKEWADKQLEKLRKLTYGQSKTESKTSLDWFYKEISGLSFRPPERFFKPLADFFVGGIFFLYILQSTKRHYRTMTSSHL